MTFRHSASLLQPSSRGEVRFLLIVIFQTQKTTVELVVVGYIIPNNTCVLVTLKQFPFLVRLLLFVFQIFVYTFLFPSSSSIIFLYSIVFVYFSLFPPSLCLFLIYRILFLILQNLSYSDKHNCQFRAWIFI